MNTKNFQRLATRESTFKEDSKTINLFSSKSLNNHLFDYKKNSLNNLTAKRYCENEMIVADIIKNDPVEHSINDNNDGQTRYFNTTSHQVFNHNSALKKKFTYERMIYEELKYKKQLKNTKVLSIIDIFRATCGWGCFRKSNPDKYEIIQRCSDIVDNHMSIDFIIKKHFELDFLKNTVLTDIEKQLLKYNYRYINFNNPKTTLEYLESVDNVKKSIQMDSFEGVDRNQNIYFDQLLEKFKNFYNY